MNVVRFNPFAEVTTLRDQINRLIDDVGQPRGEAAPGESRMWAPLVDVSESENDMVVRLDLPGVDRESIDVQLTGETLVVRGERRVEQHEGERHVHLERPAGAFRRTFNVSLPIRADGVSAVYKDGVLTVSLPKQEAVKPRKIQIQGNGLEGQG